MRGSELNCLVTLLGLIEELESCLYTAGCRIHDKLREYKKCITERIIAEGINLLERITSIT